MRNTELVWWYTTAFPEPESLMQEDFKFQAKYRVSLSLTYTNIHKPSVKVTTKYVIFLSYIYFYYSKMFNNFYITANYIKDFLII